jgi:hypothetical protein
MNFIVLAITAAAIFGSVSLPAHAAVSQSTVENTLQKLVDTILTNQTTESENIDSLFTDTTEQEEIEREANDFPINTEDDLATPTEEIIARTVACEANERCFGVKSVTPPLLPLLGISEKIPPSDEDPTADDESTPAFKSWDELIQRLDDLKMRPIDVEADAT